ncbi:hypothetical protein SAMN04487965_0874 [Microbulbifer donghaiensis]|uniref:Uncharacterized protein n=1 Tax=Microbulbifer donghaiensis TaxID=494016 RepID=A0A1M4X649_9GAMM|nr:hypothetical protein SAMN04487965_0874 [Microbulbifer donghaiensis]
MRSCNPASMSEELAGLYGTNTNTDAEARTLAWQLQPSTAPPTNTQSPVLSPTTRTATPVTKTANAVLFTSLCNRS